MATNIGTVNRPMNKGNSGTVTRSLLSNARSAASAGSGNVGTPQAASAVQASNVAPKAPSQPSNPIINGFLPDSYKAPYDFDQGLRPQVSRDILQAWFNTNKNPNNFTNDETPGGISKKELTLIQTRANNREDTESLNATLSTSLLKYGFERADLDKNGSLDMAEIEKARGAVTVEQGRTMDVTRSRFNEIFNQGMTATNDGGGGISFADLSTLTRGGLNNNHQTPVFSLLKRDFKKFDQDRNGFISQNELSAAKFKDGPNVGRSLFNITA